MDLFIIYFLVGGLICAGVGGYIAEEKNRGVGNWAILCFLLGIFGIIAIAAVPSLSKKAESFGDGLGAESIKREFPRAKIHLNDARFHKDSQYGDTSFLVVDFEQRQIVVGARKALKNPPKEPYRKSFAFFDIVKAEIVRDGSQVVTTGTANQELKDAKHIAIRITVKNPDNPTYDVTFYASITTKYRKLEYPPFDHAVQKVIEFQGYLESAIRETRQEKTGNSQNPDASEQLSRLWQLKQEGALTQEEFEAQKAKLLQS